MRSIQITTDCDQCLNDTSGDMHIAADFTMFYQVSEDGGRYRIDLCANHASMLTMMEVLNLGTIYVPDAELQATPPLAMRGRAQVPCEWCRKPYAAGSGMSLHIKSKHPEHWEPGPAALAVKHAKAAKHKKDK